MEHPVICEEGHLGHICSWVKRPKRPKRTPTLARLSPEILHTICDFLYDDDCSGSVLSFARTSKTFYSIAKVTLSRIIKFTVFPTDFDPPFCPDGFHNRIKQRVETLRRDGTFASVRRLVVGGSISSKDVYPATKFQGLNPKIRHLERFNNEMTLDGYLGDDDPWTQRQEATFTCHWDQVDGHSERFWKPMAELITLLPGLTDLLFECCVQFPSCMLTALHSSLPGCRLHLRNFSIDSIHKAEPSLRPYEKKLLSSRCLSSLRCWYAPANSQQEDEDAGNNLMNAVITSFAAKMAPSLRELSLRYPEAYNPIPIPLGLVESSGSAQRTKATLQCLHIHGSSTTINSNAFEAWNSCTDFTVLQKFQIHTGLTIDAIQFLADSKFPLLKVLEVGFAPEFADEEYCETAVRFLRQVSPQLNSLRLFDWAPMPYVQEMLGSNLRCLELISIQWLPFNEEGISQIHESSPLIEEMIVPVHRSQGDAAEFAMYTALGKFRRLQDLWLQLTVVPPTLPIQIFDEEFGPEFGPNNQEHWYINFNTTTAEFKQTYRKFPPSHPYTRHHIQDLFRNLALDATLAASVYRAIAAQRGSTQSSPLKHLRLSTMGWDTYNFFPNTVYDKESLKPYYNLIGLAWMLTPSVRDSSIIDFHALEHNPENLSTSLRSLRDLKHPFTSAFMEIWPDATKWRYEPQRQNTKSFLCISETQGQASEPLKMK